MTTKSLSDFDYIPNGQRNSYREHFGTGKSEYGQKKKGERLKQGRDRVGRQKCHQFGEMSSKVSVASAFS